MRYYLVFVATLACGKSADQPAAAGSAAPPPLVPATLVDCMGAGWCRLPGSLPGDFISAMTSGRPGTFWAVANTGLVVHWDNVTAQHWYLDGLTPEAVWSDGTETWVATYEGVAARFQDHTWSRIDVDRKEHLRTVSGVRGDGVWFTTDTGALIHIKAGSIARVELPNGNIRAVWVAAPDDVWVVWSAHVPRDRMKWNVSRWNGKAWRDMALPTESIMGSLPPGITGLGPDDVWVVASPAFHWDGTAWSAPQAGGQGVSMSAHDDVVVDHNGDYSIWDGKTWTRHYASAPSVSIGAHRIASGLELHDGDKVTRLPVGSGIEAYHLWVGPDAIYEAGLSLDHRDRLAIARWDGVRWTREELAGTRPSAIAGIDTPWVLDLAGALWHRDGASWVSEATGVWLPDRLAVVGPDDVWVGSSNDGTLRHRLRGVWTHAPEDHTTAIDAIGAGAGQLFIARKRNGTRELARWNGSTFESVVALPEMAHALAVRSDHDVEIALAGSVQRWRGGALEKVDDAGSYNEMAADGATTYVSGQRSLRPGVLVVHGTTADWHELPCCETGVAARNGHAWAMHVPSGDLRVRATP